jgi:DNA-directed RNA polymerase II subunit RPB2
MSVSPDGYKIIKIKIRSYKIPEIGDKVCSRNAQKGTVGLCLPQEDMPFTSSGIVPDIIINPLCLPSRMTINQVIECLAAKCAVNSGQFRYATAFSSHSHDVVNDLCETLGKYGFQRHGYETMYNGFLGHMMEAKIFIGPTYYQRLKHLVSAKIHARNHGSIQALTRQPLEGRSRDGGLRFGEMEKDCMISHGVSRFLTERLFDMSDRFVVPLCLHCGTMVNEPRQCMMCNKTDVVQAPIPYACKLLFQELNAMGIKTQLLPTSELNKLKLPVPV